MTTPFPPGVILTEERLNSALGARLRRLVPAAEQTFASSSSSSQIVGWQSAAGDDGDASGIALVADELVVSEAGVYLVESSVGWQTSSPTTSGRRATAIAVNGTIIAIETYQPTGVPAFPCSAILRLEPGDAVHVRALQTNPDSSPADEPLNTNLGNNRTRFEMVKLVGS